jgi:hypothetical protein
VESYLESTTCLRGTRMDNFIEIKLSVKTSDSG